MAAHLEEKGNTHLQGLLEPKRCGLCMQARLQQGAYYAREDYLVQLEKEGEISFQYVKNDGQEHNMIFLIGLKNIYSKQVGLD